MAATWILRRDLVFSCQSRNYIPIKNLFTASTGGEIVSFGIITQVLNSSIIALR